LQKEQPTGPKKRGLKSGGGTPKPFAENGKVSSRKKKNNTRKERKRIDLIQKKKGGGGPIVKGDERPLGKGYWVLGSTFLQCF